MVALALILVSLGAGDHDRSLSPSARPPGSPGPLHGRPRAAVSGTQTRIAHRAVEPEVARWVAHDRCAAEPRPADRRGVSTRGGVEHTATLLVWAPCAGGAEVQLWKLTGAGHGWPGSHVRLPERILGPETTGIDAASEVWRFLSRFRRADAPTLD